MVYQSRKDLYKNFGQTLIIHLLLFLTGSLLLSYFDYIGFSQTELVFVSCITTVLTYLVPIKYFCYVSDTKFADFFQPTEKKKIKGTKTYIILFIIAASLTVTAVTLFGKLSEIIFSLFGFTATQAQIKSLPLYTATFLRNVCIAAFFEELLFRGVLLFSFKKQSVVMKALISALLFAFMHCNITQFLYAFVAGFIIAFFTLLTGSLSFAIAVHFFQNLTTFVFTVVYSYCNPEIQKTVSSYTFLIFLSISVIYIIAFCFYKPLKKFLYSALNSENNFVDSAESTVNKTKYTPDNNRSNANRLTESGRFFSAEILVYICFCFVYSILVVVL